MGEFAEDLVGEVDIGAVEWEEEGALEAGAAIDAGGATDNEFLKGLSEGIGVTGIVFAIEIRVEVLFDASEQGAGFSVWEDAGNANEAMFVEAISDGGEVELRELRLVERGFLEQFGELLGVNVGHFGVSVVTWGA